MKQNFSILLMAFGFALLIGDFGIRICPFFNLFNIPCAGCGMTRAFRLILEGNIIESFKYNILPLPLLFLIIIYILFYIKNKKKLDMFLNKNKTILIILSLIITLIVWLINISNDLLY